VIALLMSALPRTARADIPADRQAVILSRALAYDNNLRSRAGDTVVVAILYKSGNGASESAADAIFRAFKALESVKIQDLPLRTVKVAFSSKDALRAAVSSQGIDAIYSCPGLEGEVGSIKEVSHRERVLTIGAREEFLESGLSLGVFMVETKATITVNLQASREEGASFSSELLRVARVLH
jgi:hypothetical protein